MNAVIRNFFYFFLYLLKLPSFLLRKSTVSYTTKSGLSSVIVRSRVGRYGYIGGAAHIVDSAVGNYCSIAAGVMIGGMEHPWWWLSTSTHLSDFFVKEKTTVIEDDVWIGANAIVRQGVKVHRGAVIGAGAVVLADVPPFAVVVGVPAKVIRSRFEDRVIKEILLTEYWIQPPSIARKRLKQLSKELDL